MSLIWIAIRHCLATLISSALDSNAMSTGSDFSDEPQHAPWATAGSQDSSTYTPTIEDATNDIPILQITTRAEYTPRTTPHGLLLIVPDAELLLASEQYEALQDTTDATVPLDDVAMNPFTPIPTFDDVYVAHTLAHSKIGQSTPYKTQMTQCRVSFCTLRHQYSTVSCFTSRTWRPTLTPYLGTRTMPGHGITQNGCRHYFCCNNCDYA